MLFLASLAAVLLSYIVGSVPFGLLVVRVASGKDVRTFGSGRTGGTNVMRAAGWFAGVITAILDVMKGVSSGWIVGWLVGDNPWIRIFAAAAAVLGSIHSIFLLQQDENGKYHLRGGAGGATSLGGAIALWANIWWFILPAAAFVYVFVGFASLTTMSIAFTALTVFAYRAIVYQEPLEYIGYGVLACALVIHALQPNLKRLRDGNERAVGLRAYFRKRSAAKKS